MSAVGDVVSSDLEIASLENEIIPISQLFYGAEAVIIFFVSYCYGDPVKQSMESLLMEVNDHLDEFNQHDLRVVCISREPPSTISHWVSDREFQFEAYSDASLTVSNALVGSFDISIYVQATKGVNLGSYFVPMASVVAIGGDGKILSRYVASSPGKLVTFV
jgi:peroxiredoxin